MTETKLILISKDNTPIQLLFIGFFVQLIGIILIAGSGFLWWKLLLGALIIIAGLFLISLKSETYFDIDANALRGIWKGFFWSNTQQEILPEIDYIAIVRIKTSKKQHYKSISRDEETFKFQVNLIYLKSYKRYKKLISTSKEKAFDLAKSLSKVLEKPILDQSTSQKKWVNKEDIN